VELVGLMIRSVIRIERGIGKWFVLAVGWCLHSRLWLDSGYGV
jgi:hypothetical protein